MSFETAVIGHEVYTFKVDNHSEYACSKMMSQLHEN